MRRSPPKSRAYMWGVRLLLLNLLLIAGLPVAAYVGFFGMWCGPRANTELWRCRHYPIGFLVYMAAVPVLAVTSVYLQSKGERRQ